MPESKEAALFKALFAPDAVALIGASDDQTKNASRPLRFLRRHGYAGAIYPINPNRSTIFDERAFPNLAAVPGRVDHAYILLGAEAAIEAVASCAAAGVPAATLLADGFAEAGPDGVERQRRLLAAAHRGNVRLVGPNSLGIVNAATGLVLSANAAFQAERLLPGRLTVLSQSGSVIGTLLSRGFARGIGFSKLVSVGNEADLDLGTIGLLAVDDPETSAFLLFLEAVRRPDCLAAFARRAHDAGKPVLAYVLGRSDLGQELAFSHTGALAGTRQALSAFLADNGIVQVDCLETLLEAPDLFIGRAPHPPDASRAVGIVTTTGGGGAMVADGLGAAGIAVATPRVATRAALATAGIKPSEGRIIDVTLAGTRPDVMTRVLDAMIAAPEFDVIVSVIGSSAQFYPELAAEPVAAAGRRSAKPVAAFALPEAPAALDLLAQAGVAAFRTPEACVDALRAFLAWRPPRVRPQPFIALDGAEELLATADEQLDERLSLALFASLGIACAPSILLGEDAPAIAYPAVAKILSADIAHKSDAGGVALNLPDETALRRAAQALIERMRQSHPHAKLAGILVQPMERGLGEVLIGYRLDPQVGPVVTVAPGGVLAELYGDAATRPAPVDKTAALAMIAAVKGLRALDGYRNLPRGDLDAVADAIVRLSELARLRTTTVLDAEINPLIVKPAGQGVVAVDGLVRLRR